MKNEPDQININAALVLLAATLNAAHGNFDTKQEVVSLLRAAFEKTERQNFDDLDGVALKLWKDCGGIIPMHRARVVTDALCQCVPAFVELMNAVGLRYEYAAAEPPPVSYHVPTPPPVATGAPAATAAGTVTAAPDGPVNLRAGKPLPPLYEDSPQPLRSKGKPRELGKGTIDEDSQ